ncbi:MAG: T9SS type A sorting domain-containing protein [Prevotellaceae bacterium]|jgi:hypothetical protein|nr:T9SS type A sorting domain-containing protein [Prevotellaceae bacterium]
MKKQLFQIILFFLLFCGKIFAQTPQPLSAVYIACQNVQVKVGFSHDNAIEYWWYSAQAGGTLLAGTSRDNFDIVKNYMAVQTIWAEPRINGVPQPRIPVILKLSQYCGSTDEDYANPSNPANSSCYASGNLLFKQDFGGNNTSDPYDKGSGIISPNEQIANGWMYLSDLNSHSVYCIAKGVPWETHSTTWTNFDDHTYPNDYSRGYFIGFEADDIPGKVFYEMQIDNLCIGAELTFTVWVRSFLSSTHADHTNLIFRAYDIDGNELATYFTGDLPDVMTSWRNYGFTFTTPSSSVKIKITNNGGTQGNDFGMDDIQVHLCVPPVLLTAMNISACTGSEINVRSNFNNTNSSGGNCFIEPLAYQWYYSMDGNADIDSWTSLPAQTEENLYIAQMTEADTGYYYVAIAGSGGIDYANCRTKSPSVHIGMGTTIAHTRDIKICGGSYSFYGDIKTESGSWQKTVNNPEGCDSIITLNLTVNQHCSDTQYVVVCDKELPYLWRDTVFLEGTSSSQIIFNKKTSAGCDSIVTLNLTVNPAYNQIESISICSSQLPYLWRDTVFESGTASKQIIFNKKTSLGCDSIVTLNLEINHCNEITVFPPGEICADDASFVLKYSIAEGVLPCCNVKFNEKAKSAGFVDIDCLNAATDTEIEIPLPQFEHPKYLKPDNYSMSLSFEINNETDNRSIEFTVLYPSWIMEQNWNDVIALLNSTNNRNGGYDFSAYQWYIDEKPIEKQTGSYLYEEGKTLQIGRSYRVLLTRKGEDYAVFTCALKPVEYQNTVEKPVVEVREGIIRINSSQNCVLNIFNIAGIFVGNWAVNVFEQEINISIQKGMYIFQIIFEDGTGQTFKMVI